MLPHRIMLINVGLQAKSGLRAEGGIPSRVWELAANRGLRRVSVQAQSYLSGKVYRFHPRILKLCSKSSEVSHQS
jgi:hypothetical protein